MLLLRVFKMIYMGLLACVCGASEFCKDAGCAISGVVHGILRSWSVDVEM